MNQRAVKLEKYMIIEVNESVIKDKFDATDIPNLYNVGIDFSLDANIFYGVKTDGKLYERIPDIRYFDDYVAVFRLLNWCRNYNSKDYTFRVLKANANEEVDFAEEREYLNSFIQLK